MLLTVPGNIHSGVSGNDSIMATGVYSAQELLRVTRRECVLLDFQQLVLYVLSRCIMHDYLLS